MGLSVGFFKKIVAALLLYSAAVYAKQRLATESIGFDQGWAWNLYLPGAVGVLGIFRLGVPRQAMLVSAGMATVGVKRLWDISSGTAGLSMSAMTPTVLAFAVAPAVVGVVSASRLFARTKKR